MTDSVAICPWCERPLPPGPIKGTPRRFCSATHRNAYWSAGRRWIAAAIAAGLITMRDIRRFEAGVHALPMVQEPTGEVGPS